MAIKEVTVINYNCIMYLDLSVAFSSRSLMILDDSAGIHICEVRETIAESNEGKQVHTYLRKNAKVTARHNVYTQADFYEIYCYSMSRGQSYVSHNPTDSRNQK